MRLRKLRKTLRGGAWHSNPRDCRSASRSRVVPGNLIDNFGFRVVCNEEDPPLALQLRGGSWFTFVPRYCRSATAHFHGEIGCTPDNFGFRVVCKEEP